MLEKVKSKIVKNTSLHLVKFLEDEGFDFDISYYRSPYSNFEYVDIDCLKDKTIPISISIAYAGKDQIKKDIDYEIQFLHNKEYFAYNYKNTHLNPTVLKKETNEFISFIKSVIKSQSN
jgi:hypothetical protein